MKFLWLENSLTLCGVSKLGIMSPETEWRACWSTITISWDVCEHSNAANRIFEIISNEHSLLQCVASQASACGLGFYCFVAVVWHSI